VLYRLVDQGVELRVALLGESFQFVPQAFLEARERLGQRVVQYGFAPDREEYLGWLGRGDVVVSTAIQENFGIAVVEAIRLGCCPLLPARLSYPELIPEGFHDRCLYRDEEELAARLAALLRDPQACDPALAQAMDRFSWERQIEAFDSELDRLASAGAGHAAAGPPEEPGAAKPRTGGTP
jgi:glycosyltransferase involved in cell wall biosynthesis